MASFQVKICWEGPRKRENKKIKKIVPTSSYTTRNRKFQKIKKHHYDFFSSQNKLGKAEKEEKKIVLMSSYPTRNIKFQKNSKKVYKIKKYHYGFSSGQNKFEMAEKERK